MALREMRDGELARWGNLYLNRLTRCLRKGVDKFGLSGDVSIENIGTDELQVSVVGWQGLSIDLIETERRTIGRSVMVPAWQLTKCRHIASGRWEPEGVEDVPVSVHQSFRDAVVALVNAIREIEVAEWIGNAH